MAFLASGALLLGLFIVRERHTAHPLIDLSLFRNLPFDLVTFLGSVCHIAYGVVVVVVSLYLQQVRGLSPLQAGTVFLGMASLVAVAGPVGARLQPHFRPTLIMAFAGTTAALAIISLTFVTSWWAFVPIFAICGFGLGLGWTFASIATPEVVDPARAGEASGIVLTFLVTLGGIGLAAAASIISALERSGHTPRSAQETTLVIYALLSVAAAAIVMSIRAYPVRRGLMAPLSMAADQAAEPVPAAHGDRGHRPGRAFGLATCPCA
ncbi:MAG TPA: MFS transporter [Streptosporangiaceae bacterium]